MRLAAAIASLAALVIIPLLLERAPAVAPPAQAYFSLDEIARADRYASLRLPLGLAGVALGVIVTLILAVGPGARALGAWAQRVTNGRWLLTSLLLAAVVAIIPAIVLLPITLLRYRIDRDFGLATNSTSAVLLDVVRATAFGIGLALLAAVGFVALAKLLPRAWPFAVAGAGSVMLVALVLLLPVVYEPMFNDFTSVAEPTRGRILELADRAGVPVSDVLVADASKRTARHNAYVSGLGATRRVVLYDTLLDGAPAAEVDLVVAHELGHVARNDVRNATLLGILGLLVGVAVLAMLLRSPAVLASIGARNAADPRIVPFIAAFVAVAGLTTTPLQSLISRRAEAAADRFALALAGDTEIAISLEQRLARTNLSDLTPNVFVHRFFGSHPTTMERIGIALETSQQPLP